MNAVREAGRRSQAMTSPLSFPGACGRPRLYTASLADPGGDEQQHACLQAFPMRSGISNQVPCTPPCRPPHDFPRTEPELKPFLLKCLCSFYFLQ